MLVFGVGESTMAAQELGIIGLGHIGGNLARQALEKDIRIVGMDTQGARLKEGCDCTRQGRI